MCGVGFRGESEYEVSFGLAPLNGELSLSVPETPEPFSFPFRPPNPERSSDSNFRRIWGPAAYAPGDKRSMVTFFFENGEWQNWIFLNCHIKGFLYVNIFGRSVCVGRIVGPNRKFYTVRGFLKV